jgi:hypothetical protein
MHLEGDGSATRKWEDFVYETATALVSMLSLPSYSHVCPSRTSEANSSAY